MSGKMVKGRIESQKTKTLACLRVTKGAYTFNEFSFPYRFISGCIPQHFRSYPAFGSWYPRAQWKTAPTVWDLLTQPKVWDEGSDLTQSIWSREQNVSGLEVAMDYIRKRKRNFNFQQSNCFCRWELGICRFGDEMVRLGTIFIPFQTYIEGVQMREATHGLFQNSYMIQLRKARGILHILQGTQ